MPTNISEYVINFADILMKKKKLSADSGMAGLSAGKSVYSQNFPRIIPRKVFYFD
jgi:hypothetical protein